MNSLDGLLRAFPEKACPQRGMAAQDLLPGPLKGDDVQLLAENGNELLDIDTRLRRRQAMDEHAVLYRRQKVRVFNLHKEKNLVSMHVRHYRTHLERIKSNRVFNPWNYLLPFFFSSLAVSYRSKLP